MKKKYILLFILSLLYLAGYPQDANTNLQKYWNYRGRFFKYFIAATSDYNKQGSNYPAMRISGTTLDFGDGNGGMQYYIGWLATEYRLLQYYGQDKTETRNYLLWALKSVERLDRTAEMYFRGNTTPLPNDLDLNGFFIRDDVDNGIKAINTNLKDFTIGSTYTGNIGFLPNDYAHIRDFEASKDVIWNYLINLALVKVLVDDPEINELARSIAYRMVKWMHYDHSGSYVLVSKPEITIEFDKGWFISNPVKECVINNGKDGRGVIDEASLTGLSYGFAKAANWITGDDWRAAHNFSSLDWRDALSDGNKGLFNEGLSCSGNYSYLSLATIADIKKSGGACSTVKGLIGFLLSITGIYATGEIGMTYPHLGLIHLLLHGRQSIATNSFFEDPIDPNDADLSYINTAPECGTNYWNPGTSWYHDNWLIWPDKDPKFAGDFNGIDYMLLHNLTWLVYYIPYTEHFDLVNDYPVPPLTYGSNQFPALHRAFNYINCSSHLNNYANVNLYSKKINLKSGFKTEIGAKFKAKSCFNDESIPNFSINSASQYCPHIYQQNPIPPLYSDLILKSGELSDDQINVNTNGLNENTKVGKVEIYPNPNTGSFSVFFENQTISNIDIYNEFGQEINYFVNSKGNNSWKITLSDSKKGIYLLRLKCGKNLYNKKIIVQ